MWKGGFDFVRCACECVCGTDAGLEIGGLKESQFYRGA